ncbi:MAG TPA: DEAD/DEAH box helicase [Mucilaginibacter sp.]
MDAFKTHEQVISDYKAYLQSFINIKDEKIKEYINSNTLVEQILPEPLIQFNPSFEKGSSLNELIGEGLIHRDLPKALGAYRLYRHQVEAIKIGTKENKGYVVTSGTGSGKSLTFLATIFNDIFKIGEPKPKGIKAILVYPMNALINSQYEEIKKYAENFENAPQNYGKEFPVSFGQYTGQESSDDRERIKNSEPDILLTNYMMLELIMTRQSESWLRESLKNNLKYIVFDELHTYRGRQGSDVSVLNRRIQALANNNLIFIGTSATMASKGTPAEKKEKVAEVASLIFGKPYEKDQIVSEYLEPCTEAREINPFELAAAIKKGIDPNADESIFIQNPLANWLEMKIALVSNEGTLERGKPKSSHAITKEIQSVTSLGYDEIKKALHDLLKWAEKVNEDNRTRKTRKTFLPFRFHQFISQTGSISATLEPRLTRFVTSSDELYTKQSGKEQKLYPVLFSRYSGYDFICVELSLSDKKILPAHPDRDFKIKKKDEVDNRNLSQEDFKYGYIVLDEGEEFWQSNFEDMAPADWYQNNGTGLALYYRMLMPKAIYFNADGDFSFDPLFPIKGYFMPAKLRIDPTAQIVYEDSRTNEFTKLARLGSEGRSTATSVISYAIVNSLADQKEAIEDQKLLSFTDNRQDASLQAGHFNDFYATIRLRSALYNAVKKAEKPLEIHEIAESLYKELNLKEIAYATEPSIDENFPDDRNVEALKEYLRYRVLRDLRQGWRYTLPNLEQVALLKIDYKNLQKLAAGDSYFENLLFLKDQTPDKRYEVLKNILDYFRTNYALDHRFFRDIANIESLMRDRLDVDKIWSLNYNEKIDKPTHIVIKAPKPTPKGFYAASIGERSNLGKYLNRLINDSGLPVLRKSDYADFIKDICDLLKRANLITIEETRPGLISYKLRADSILWMPGAEQHISLDQTQFNFRDEMLEIYPNPYFQKLYQADFNKTGKELIAREHTGQLGSEDRKKREGEFRQGKISAMYCSPTMELGIDIANLNIVHMRNVPPNAANYAQRSGRAGRSGQTALVFTYCSTMSPHDVNYFKNSAEMVAGTVQPPKIDLNNEELISSHLNAFLMMNLEVSELRTSAADVLDLTDEQRIFVKDDIIERINTLTAINRSAYITAFRKIIESCFSDVDEISWITDKWLNDRIEKFALSFSSSFKRWIRMFQNACQLRTTAQAVLDNHTFKSGSEERRGAERQERFARKQIALLKNETRQNSSSSEFYIFRYLAAEGFLPGYNFTRLPVRAMLGKSYRDDVEVLSRPRALALSEFGPNNTVYHSGNKYRVNRMMVTDLENSLEKIQVSASTGYAFMADEIKVANVDPITKAPIVGKDLLKWTRALEFTECEGMPVEKITCIEEERTRAGYETFSFFNFPAGIENARSIVLKRDGEKLLQLYFSNTTDLIKVNTKARKSQNSGFKINKTNGVWVRDNQLTNNAQLQSNTVDGVVLYTKETADALYIQPLSNIGTKPEEVVSLSYALKRGIEKLFLVEESEIAVTLMGDPEKPNIMIYEASEGSLGILSQLVNDLPKMKEWFKASYEAIHYDPETFEETNLGKTLPKATYQDLLSYYNQTYHKQLSRELVAPVIKYLIQCEISPVQGSDRDRDDQYQHLLDTYDTNSSTELQLIKYLYNNDYALPDKAQVNLEDYYISADFVYKRGDQFTLVFCDGSAHDSPEQQETDNKKRQILADAGYDYIVWHYTEKVEDLIQKRKDIFRKVK